jgi:hypothetical protein
MTAEVVDISFGGVGLVTNEPPRRGHVYEIVLRQGKRAASCGATASHARRGADGRWLVGMAFVQDERLALVERLVDHLTGDQIQFS